MWTRSAKDKVTGKITVVCTDWNGNEFFKGDFDNVVDADRAGEAAERNMMLAMESGFVSTGELPEMSDDELLSELGL